MEKILTELCHEVNNYFPVSKHMGKFKVVDEALVNMPAEIQEGQYFRILGSVFNKGVYKYDNSLKLINEREFEGSVWLLAIPQDFVALAEEIDAWQTKYGGVDSAAMSPYTSESMGNYSYSKGGASASSKGSSSNPNSWQTLYGDRLNKYRRLRGIL